LNYFATTYSVHIEEQFKETVLKITPKLNKIGIPCHIGELQSNVEHDEVREFCKRNNITCHSFDIQSHDDLKEAAKYFENEEVGWVFLGSDSIIATATTKQLEPITTKFPTLCALQDTVTHNGLISYHIPWKIICQNAAEFAVKLLNGSDIKEGIVVSSERRIVINKDALELFKNIKILDKFDKYKTV